MNTVYCIIEGVEAINKVLLIVRACQIDPKCLSQTKYIVHMLIYHEVSSRLAA